MQTKNNSIYIQQEGKSADNTVVFTHVFFFLFVMKIEPRGRDFTPELTKVVVLQMPGGKKKEGGAAS